MAKRRKQRAYQVVPVGDKWAILRGDDPRPVGERLYPEATHAHRRRRKLEKDAQVIDEMIKQDGAIIL